MRRIKPQEGETPLAFVERADALNVSGKLVIAILREHYGLTDERETKELRLKSQEFWRNFYVDRVSEIFERGGARYAAQNFIRRKNGVVGQKRLSEQEIDAIVDGAGCWQR